MKPFFCCPEYNVIGIKYFAKYLMKQGQGIWAAGQLHSGPDQHRSTITVGDCDEGVSRRSVRAPKLFHWY